MIVNNTENIVLAVEPIVGSGFKNLFVVNNRKEIVSDVENYRESFLFKLPNVLDRLLTSIVDY